MYLRASGRGHAHAAVETGGLGVPPWTSMIRLRARNPPGRDGDRQDPGAGVEPGRFSS